MIAILLIALAGWLVFHLPGSTILLIEIVVAGLDLVALQLFGSYYDLRWCSVCRAYTARHGLIWWSCVSGRHQDEAEVLRD